MRPRSVRPRSLAKRTDTAARTVHHATSARRPCWARVAADFVAVRQGLRAQLTLGDSAEQAGVPVQTVKNWLTRGRSEAGMEHAAFAAAIDAGREAAGRARSASASSWAA